MLHRLFAFLAGLGIAAAFAQPVPEPLSIADEMANGRAMLDRIPQRDALLARIQDLGRSGVRVTDVALAGNRVFYAKHGGAPVAEGLYWREGLAGTERLLLDVGRLAGPSATITAVAPAPDGHHVALAIANASGEAVRVVAVEGGRVDAAAIEGVRDHGALAWHSDSRAFYYARGAAGATGREARANTRIYRHALGHAVAQDEIVFAPGVGGARDVPALAVVALQVPLQSRYAYALVHDGADRVVSVHITDQRELAAGRPHWHRLAGPADEVLAIQAWHDDLYVLTRRGAPRHRVLLAKATALDLSGARVAVPEGDSVIRAMALARDALYLQTMVAGVDRLERLRLGLLAPKAAEFVRIPFDTGIVQLLTQPLAEGALLRLEGWIEAPAIVQVDRRGDAKRTAIQPPPLLDASDLDEVRLYATAADGMKVPVTLVYRKSTRLSGDHPLLLMVYGANGVPFSPAYDPRRIAWLERGGVLAIAHVRGGGEYGEAWHQAARGRTKAVAMSDLASVADFISAYGFTSAKRLAVQGSGPGSLVAAGAALARPELFAAVVAREPALDLLQYGATANGAGEIADVGSAATPEGREALQALSPVEQVREGAKLPALLLMPADADEGAIAARMAARVRAANPDGRPVVVRPIGVPAAPLRVRDDEERADLYAFLLWQMGEPAFQPDPTVAR